MDIQDFIADFKGHKRMSAKEQLKFLQIIRTPPEGKTESDTWELTEEQKAAREEFIIRNLRLAVFFVKRYCNVNDARFTILLSSAVEGMIHALDNFKLVMNTKFSTYANFWIRARVFSELKVIEPDTRRYKSLNEKLKRVRNNAKAQNIFLSDAEIYDILKWDQTAIMRYEMDSSRLTIDVDTVDTLDPKVQQDSALLFEEDGDTIIQNMIQNEDVATMFEGLDLLPEPMPTIIRRHYGLEGEAETYDALAAELGMTREHVRQSENKGIRLLWLYMTNKDAFYLMVSKSQSE